jgi:hypothetical protein
MLYQSDTDEIVEMADPAPIRSLPNRSADVLRGGEEPFPSRTLAIVADDVSSSPLEHPASRCGVEQAHVLHSRNSFHPLYEWLHQESAVARATKATFSSFWSASAAPEHPSRGLTAFRIGRLQARKGFARWQRQFEALSLPRRAGWARSPGGALCVFAS